MLLNLKSFFCPLCIYETVMTFHVLTPISRIASSVGKIQSILGMRFHHNFPKLPNYACHSECGGCGIFPNVYRGRRGVQLVTRENSWVLNTNAWGPRRIQLKTSGYRQFSLLVRKLATFLVFVCIRGSNGRLVTF